MARFYFSPFVRSRDRDGSAAVEFAFVLPILLLLFSGIVQFGSIMFLESHMTNVARETSRPASPSAS